MARRNDDGILDLLALLPWWVSVVLSLTTFLALTYLIPTIAFENPVIRGFAKVAPQLAYIFALILLFPAPVSFLNRRKKRKRLDAQKNIETIRSLTWREFEELVAEAYRRKGFSVVENTRAGADGGVDIRLRRGSETHLVQCKQWRSQKVGVAIVREMFGILNAEGAASVAIISSGMFTQEAHNFATDKPIDLIDGHLLFEMVSSVQNSYRPLAQETATESQPVRSTQSKVCPSCGSELVVRVAKKGSNTGGRFYGCSAFPRCRYTESE